MIYTCEETYFKGIHFDTRQQHSIQWTKGRLDEAAEQLKLTIYNTLPEQARPPVP